ncbi:MAG: hypothetical protein H6714_03970 [Myxococcales bacterium]|nr:hypothetical protein [Myxococcales bacterium]
MEWLVGSHKEFFDPDLNLVSCQKVGESAFKGELAEEPLPTGAYVSPYVARRKRFEDCVTVVYERAVAVLEAHSDVQGLGILPIAAYRHSLEQLKTETTDTGALSSSLSCADYIRARELPHRLARELSVLYQLAVQAREGNMLNDRRPALARIGDIATQVTEAPEDAAKLDTFIARIEEVLDDSEGRIAELRQKVWTFDDLEEVAGMATLSGRVLEQHPEFEPVYADILGKQALKYLGLGGLGALAGVACGAPALAAAAASLGAGTVSMGLGAIPGIAIAAGCLVDVGLAAGFLVHDWSLRNMALQLRYASLGSVLVEQSAVASLNRRVALDSVFLALTAAGAISTVRSTAKGLWSRTAAIRKYQALSDQFGQAYSELDNLQGLARGALSDMTQAAGVPRPVPVVAEGGELYQTVFLVPATDLKNASGPGEAILAALRRQYEVFKDAVASGYDLGIDPYVQTAEGQIALFQFLPHVNPDAIREVMVAREETNLVGPLAAAVRAQAKASGVDNISGLYDVSATFTHANSRMRTVLETLGEPNFQTAFLKDDVLSAYMNDLPWAYAEYLFESPVSLFALQGIEVKASWIVLGNAKGTIEAGNAAFVTPAFEQGIRSAAAGAAGGAGVTAADIARAANALSALEDHRLKLLLALYLQEGLYQLPTVDMVVQ